MPAIKIGGKYQNIFSQRSCIVTDIHHFSTENVVVVYNYFDCKVGGSHRRIKSFGEAFKEIE